MLTRAPRRVVTLLRGNAVRVLDRFRTTYSDRDILLPRQLLPNGLEWIDPDQQDVVFELANLYRAHRFDLLGSGWLAVGFDAKSPGFEGHRYDMSVILKDRWESPSGWPAATKREATRIRSGITSAYHPIDWHRDHKSGYRWSSHLHASACAQAPAPGVDIKMPWELSRMQHLPILAHAYALAARSDESVAEPYRREFEDQVRDFIAANPPRIGVNWHCTMDVGIRVANWVLSYELMRVSGAAFSNEFVEVLTRSVYDHARHIGDHLEYSPDHQDNHYLANLGGLLFAAAFLPPMAESDAWMAFGIQELVMQISRQFHEDGSGFEGSVPYHALSLEIALWSAWLVEVLDAAHRRAIARHMDKAASLPRAQPLRWIGIRPYDGLILPAGTWNRLKSASRFLADVTRPDGTLPQIGDDDSGRFVRLSPRVRLLRPQTARREYVQLSVESIRGLETYLDDQPLDRRTLLTFAAAIFGGADLAVHEEAARPEAKLGRAIVVGCCSARAHANTLISNGTLADAEKELQLLPVCRWETRFRFSASPSLLLGLQLNSYPGMGVYIWRSSRMYLLVRCGEVGQNGRGGHAHNDQLCVELLVDGVEQVADIGTFVYTSDPDARNRFRSAQAHFVPALPDGEQNVWPSRPAELFRLVDAQPGEVLHVGSDGFAGRFSARGSSVGRLIRLHPDEIVVTDFGMERPIIQPLPRTTGYGRLRALLPKPTDA